MGAPWGSGEGPGWLASQPTGRVNGPERPRSSAAGGVRGAQQRARRGLGRAQRRAVVAGRLGDHPQRQAVGQREQDVGDRVGRAAQRRRRRAPRTRQVAAEVLTHAARAARRPRRRCPRGAAPRRRARTAGRRSPGASATMSLSDRTSAAISASQCVDAVERVVEPLHADVAVALDDLGEQALLGAEVVVQQARDTPASRATWSNVEPAVPRVATRVAHRVDDALRPCRRSARASPRESPWSRCSTGLARQPMSAIGAAVRVRLLCSRAGSSFRSAGRGRWCSPSCSALVSPPRRGRSRRRVLAPRRRSPTARWARSATCWRRPSSAARASPGHARRPGHRTAARRRERHTAGGQGEARASAVARSVSLFDGLVTAYGVRRTATAARRRRPLRRQGRGPEDRRPPDRRRGERARLRRRRRARHRQQRRHRPARRR